MGGLLDLYPKYFQKSRVFLYPLLQFPKGTGITPIGTYVRWEENIHQNKQKLICLYHNRVDPDFKKFERDVSVHPLYHSTEVVDDTKVIIFDYSSLSKDWDYFINGEYSKLSYATKDKIKKYYGNITTNSVYIDSYLYPHKYFSMYARFLNEKVKTIQTVGELCDRPNMTKETLVTKQLILK